MVGCGVRQLRTPGSHALLLAPALPSDSGEIGCVARNRSGEAAFTCRLTVLPAPPRAPPTFTEKLVSQVVQEGEPLRLQVRAAGEPTPGLLWQKVRILLNCKKFVPLWLSWQ